MKFKSKRKIKLKFKYLIFIIIIILIYLLFSYISSNFKLVTINKNAISKILSNNSIHIIYNEDDNYLNKILQKFININDPVGILKNQTENKIILKDKLKLSSYKYKVYLYNTHDLEQYKDFIQNIKINVGNASLLLSNNLKSIGIDVIVEKQKVSDLTNNDLSKSFDASKILIENIIQNENIDLFIDLHRDDEKKEVTTLELNGKKYAKVKFVVGRKNKNYMLNYNLTELINRKIKEKYPDLTRGIVLNDNYTYNQELSEKIIFINIGGYENDIVEVKNTIDLLGPIIKEVLDEEN
jgi:stage II sporulation protein P